MHAVLPSFFLFLFPHQNECVLGWGLNVSLGFSNPGIWRLGAVFYVGVHAPNYLASTAATSLARATSTIASVAAPSSCPG